ncbi:MAG: cofactor-independent phosphoglycerate mutase [Planctomycetaceae bacterium]|nr:cofactor-independent phosphoglycerate mutase [Planctomycetaceae bacterium]
MKYAIIIPDGCADWPIESLGGRTPLQAARTPNMDALAASGIVGWSKNVPDELSPGSDVATLSLLGYDPLACFTGRAPLEAAAQGIELQPNDLAFRCNLVTIGPTETMQSFTAGHITTEEATALLQTLQEELAPCYKNPIQFHSGVSYRNLLIFSENADKPVFSRETQTFPPHDYSDQPIGPALPQGPGSEVLLRLMVESRKIFADHPVNRRRIEQGKLPATQCWLWGQGRRPNIEPFAGRFREAAGGKTLRGAMITAVDLLRGIAISLGWSVLDVPGITGYLDTDFAAKGRYAGEALAECDLVCVHVEAPDESGHEGSVEKKIRSLEEIDEKIVGPVALALKKYGDWRILISPDHPTPIALKTHTHGPVPWLMAGSNIRPDAARCYDEPTANQSSCSFEFGWKLMPCFLGTEL